MSISKAAALTTSVDRLLRQLGSDDSRRAYKLDWERYVEWVKGQKIDVLKVKPRHVEDHIVSLQESGNARSTCGRALSVIRAVYGRFVLDELMEANPAREVKNPKFDSSPKTTFLTEDQAHKLLALPQETWKQKRDHICIALLLALGWRRAEVAALQVSDFKYATVSGFVKGHKYITVGVPEWVQAEVDEWLRYAGIESGPVLPRSPDNPDAISDFIVYKIVKGAAAEIGAKVSPHGLRRTLITVAIERGADLKSLQLAVGHSSQATTEKYDRAMNAAKGTPGQVFAPPAVEKKE